MSRAQWWIRKSHQENFLSSWKCQRTKVSRRKYLFQLICLAFDCRVAQITLWWAFVLRMFDCCNTTSSNCYLDSCNFLYIFHGQSISMSLSTWFDDSTDDWSMYLIISIFHYSTITWIFRFCLCYWSSHKQQIISTKTSLNDWISLDLRK